MLKIAEELDKNKLYKEANEITKIINRIAQNPPLTRADVFPAGTNAPAWNQPYTPPKEGEPSPHYWQNKTEDKKTLQARLVKVDAEIKQLNKSISPSMKNAYQAAKTRNLGGKVLYDIDLQSWDSLDKKTQNEIARKMKRLQELTKLHYKLLGHND